MSAPTLPSAEKTPAAPGVDEGDSHSNSHHPAVSAVSAIPAVSIQPGSNVEREEERGGKGWEKQLVLLTLLVTALGIVFGHYRLSHLYDPSTREFQQLAEAVYSKYVQPAIKREITTEMEKWENDRFKAKVAEEVKLLYTAMTEEEKKKIIAEATKQAFSQPFVDQVVKLVNQQLEEENYQKLLSEKNRTYGILQEKFRDMKTVFNQKLERMKQEEKLLTSQYQHLPDHSKEIIKEFEEKVTSKLAELKRRMDIVRDAVDDKEHILTQEISQANLLRNMEETQKVIEDAGDINTKQKFFLYFEILKSNVSHLDQVSKKIVEDLKDVRQTARDALNKSTVALDKVEELNRTLLNKTTHHHSLEDDLPVDYAMEATGGMVVAHSPSFTTIDPLYSILKLCKLWSCENIKDANEILRPDVNPGSCWPMNGTSGFTTIKLIHPIIPTAITIEHLDPRQAPTLQSALQNFSVYGLTSPDEPGMNLLKGEKKFEIFNHTSGQETFQLAGSEYVDFIRVNILSNWGLADYTCIYRIRVHGTPLHSPPKPSL